jgi:TonB family protein
MRLRLRFLTIAFFAVLCCIAIIESAIAQVATNTEKLENQVALVKLYTPVYPQMARIARVTGDVNIQVEVLPDGSVSSVQVISGSPLLKNAAMESAQKSTFKCQGCSRDGNSFSMTYTFGLREDIDCGVTKLRSPRCLYMWRCGAYRRNSPPRRIAVTQAGSQIKVLADAVCVETSSASSSKV